MERGFLGTGWNYDLGLTARGVGLAAPPSDPAQRAQIAEASGEASVRQAIWLILGTAVGERMGRADFGCRIHDLLFAPLSAATIGAAIRAVTQALVTWEPRIQVLSVDAHADDDQEPTNVLVIEIHYRIRVTNSRYNMVYPFYLST
ncbi:MAG: GPW/gp25 family protein [Byssovorax sp.]